MGNFKTLALAGALVTAATVQAQAADLAYPPPPPPPPLQIVDIGGWYLRGDIGITNQRVRKLTNPLDATYAGVTTVYKNFDSASLFGIGAGYKFNSWLRADLTGEYRSRANFHGQQIAYPVGGGLPNPDTYTGSKSEWVGLMNAYLDLGTWYGITPFVGAGIGFARNTIHDFTDSSIPYNSVAFGKTRSRNNFAWALHAGLSYQVTPSFAVELAYRYLNMGSGQTGDIVAYDGTNTVYNPTKFHNITSNDVKLGVRWMLTDVSESALPPSVPLVRKY